MGLLVEIENNDSAQDALNLGHRIVLCSLGRATRTRIVTLEASQMNPPILDTTEKKNRVFTLNITDFLDIGEGRSWAISSQVIHSKSTRFNKTVK